MLQKTKLSFGIIETFNKFKVLIGLVKKMKFHMFIQPALGKFYAILVMRIKVQ